VAPSPNNISRKKDGTKDGETAIQERKRIHFPVVSGFNKSGKYQRRHRGEIAGPTDPLETILIKAAMARPKTVPALSQSGKTIAEGIVLNHFLTMMRL